MPLRKVLSNVKSSRKQRKHGAAAQSFRSTDSFDTISCVSSGTPTSSKIHETPRKYETPSQAVQNNKYDHDDSENCHPNTNKRDMSMENFQMRMELAELRQRIKLLDDSDKQNSQNGEEEDENLGGGGESRSELLDLIQEKEEEIAQLNSEIHSMNDKFHQIDANLGKIQQDRENSRATVENLEAENKQIKRHLQIREQEVVTLVRRLAGEDDRAKEIASLKNTNDDLMQELERHRTMAEQMETLEAKTREMNDDLERERLSKSTLAKDLEEAQQEWGKHKVRRENEVKKLREEAQHKARRLEDLLQKKDADIVSLRNELTSKQQNHDDQIARLQMLFEKKERELRECLKNEFALTQDNMEKEANAKQAALMLKDDQITTLEAELTKGKKRIQALQSELAKSTIDAKEKIQVLQREREELDGRLSAMNSDSKRHDSKVAELGLELQHSNQRNETLAEELQRLQSALAAHRLENEKLTKNHKDAEETCRQEFAAREAELEASLRAEISHLHDEMEKKSEKALSRLKQKDQSIVALEERTSAQTQRIVEMQSQMEKLCMDSRDESRDLHEKNDVLTKDLNHVNQKLTTTEAKLSEVSKQHRTLQKTNNDLTHELQEMKRTVASRDADIVAAEASHKEKLSSLRKEAQILREKEIDLSQELDATKEDLSKEHGKLVELSSTHKRSLERNKMLEQHNTKLKDDIASLQLERSKSEAILRGNVCKLQEEMKVTSAAQDGLVGELKTTKTELADTKHKFSNLLIEHQHVYQRNEVLTKEVQTLRDNLASLDAKHNDAEREHNDEMEKLQNLIAKKESEVGESKADILKMQSLMATQAETVRTQLLARDADIQALKDAASERLEEVRSVRSELEETRNTAEREIKMLKKTNRNLEKKAEELSNEKETQLNEVSELKQNLHNSRKRNEALKNEANEYKKRIQLLEQETSVLSDLEEHMLKLEGSVTLLKQQKEHVEDESAKTIARLKEDIDAHISHGAATEKKMKEENSILRRKYDTLTNELEEKLKGCESCICSLKRDVKAKDERISMQQKEMKQQQFAAKQEVREMKTKMDKLQDDIATAKMTISTVEEEKVGLESEVEKLKQTVKSSELQFAEISADLEEQIDNARSRNSYLERELSSSFADKNSLESRLKEQIAAIKKANSHSKQELEAKLAERVATISSLVKKRNAQEQVVASLRAELELLIDSHTTEQNEQKQIIFSLRTEVEHLRSISEQNAATRDNEIDSLKEELRSCDLKMASQGQELENVKKILDERTTLLGDMVKQNTSTERDLSEARTLVNDLQEESDRYLKEKNASALKLAELETKWTEKEARLLDAFEQERSIRETTEAELQMARESLAGMKREGKDLAELEKENLILKDKVFRQEQYLKRKLKQEKILKERLAGGPRNAILDGVQISWDLEEE